MSCQLPVFWSIASVFDLLGFTLYFSWPFCSPVPKTVGFQPYFTAWGLIHFQVSLCIFPPFFRGALHTYQKVLEDFKPAALKTTRRKPHIFWLLRSLASSWDLWIFSCKCVFSLQEQLSGKAKIQCISWKKLLVYFSSCTTASLSPLSSLQAPCLQRDQLQAVLLGYSDSCVHYRRPRGKEKHVILPLSFLWGTEELVLRSWQWAFLCLQNLSCLDFPSVSSTAQ